jgi:hypothetical protein
MRTVFVARYVLGQLAGAHGRLVPLAGWRTPVRRPQVVGPESRACIEGFPRSGNWFALRAFLDANPGDASVGHHIHLAGQVARALRFGVPCLILVREPIAAVASFLVFEPRLAPRVALWSWIRYHETIARHAESIEICPFDELVESPASVVTRLNRRYGTDFTPPSLRAEDREAVFERIERDHPGYAAHQYSTPRRERERANELARERVRSEPRIDEAIALYDRLAGIARQSPAPTGE